MKEASLSLRVPESLEKELEQYVEMEDLDKSLAVRRLLHKSLQIWREGTAVKLLAEGKLSFGAAAKFSGLDVWSFSDKIREAKATWIKNKDMLEKDIKRALS